MAFIFNEVLLEKELVLEPHNRGVRYGDGLFETIKVIGGELMYAKSHFNRLARGMKILLFDVEKLDVEKIQTSCQRLLLHSNKTEGVIRINVIRKSLVDNSFDIIIEILKEDTTGKYVLNEIGLSVGFFDEYKIQPDILSTIKSNNRTIYTLAQQSKSENQDDVLLFNTENKIADATIYNVFWIKDKKLFTNPITDGGVDGVMRKIIIDKLQNTEYEVQRVSIDKEGILAADEVFLTNVVKGMRWIKSVEGVEKSCEITKKIFSKIYNNL